MLDVDSDPDANIASQGVASQGIVDAAFMGTTGLPGALAGPSTAAKLAADEEHSSGETRHRGTLPGSVQ